MGNLTRESACSEDVTPPFRGWSWVPAAMLGCYRAPPRVCSEEGGEAVPRTYGPEACEPSHPCGSR